MEISTDVQSMLNAAFIDAKERKHEYITPEHLLYASLYFELPIEIIRACGINPEALRVELEEHLRTKIPISDKDEPIQTLGFKDVLERAVLHTGSSSKKMLDLGDILVSIFDEEKSFSSYYLKREGIDRNNLLEKVTHGIFEDEDDLLFDFDELEPLISDDKNNHINSGNKKKEREIIQDFTTDLTRAATMGQLQPYIGRNDILNRVSEGTMS